MGSRDRRGLNSSDGTVHLVRLAAHGRRDDRRRRISADLLPDSLPIHHMANMVDAFWMMLWLAVY